MGPKITVIVPVYNVENYIERCVDSLVRQTLRDIEILLIDDGSTDQSGRICDKYMLLDERVRTVHKKNAGQGLARNDGIKLAQGEYICFLDSDDYLEKNACEDLYIMLKAHDADMISYGYEIDSPVGEVVKVPLIRDDVYDGEEIIESFVPHFFGDDPEDENLRGFSACMSCFRTAIIQENNICFPSEREVLTEDTVFCLEFCKKASRIITTSKVYYHYCQKADSFSQAYRPGRMKETIKMQKILKSYAKEFGLWEEKSVKIRLAMYVWVNLMADMKQNVRRKEEGISKSQIKDSICMLCNNDSIKDALEPIKKAKLPFKQKILLSAFLNRRVNLVVLLCGFRAKIRL